MTPKRLVPGDAAALSGPVAALAFVAGVAAGNGLSDAPYPRPGASPEAVKNYFSDNAGPARMSVAGQLVSAASLGVFSSSVVRLARRSDRGSGALQAAGAAGGVLSVATLGISALTSLQLSRGRADDPETAVRLHRRVFLTGGPLHGPAIALLIGTLGLAGLRTRELPGWLSAASLGTAAAGVLAPSSIRTESTVLLIPASRFTGLLLAGIAGTVLARSRR
ncbi:MAG TPA: hypothetical protein VF109_08330 [Mycobacteriales bacterium]